VSLTTYLVFLGSFLVISAILAALSTSRIRAVARKRAEQSAVGLGRWWLALRFPVLPGQRWLPGPSLDGNPVFWREWYRSKPSLFMRLAWTIYGFLGVAWIVIAVQGILAGSTYRDLIAILNVFQVGVGLLLLSVSAATSLAEERMRASLDVLLTTPLSTRSILAGKWAGAFRIVPVLLFAPVVTGLLLAGQSNRMIQYFLYVALLLAYSAVIVSMGLALATWQSRLGRALASCVATYIALTIGWPALVLAITLGGHQDDRAILPLVMGTPLYGTAFGTLGLSGAHQMPGIAADIWVGASLWIAIHGGLAALLFAATVATFDRCLGRVAEGDVMPRTGTWKKWEPGLDPYFDDDIVTGSSRQPV
jgi:ABC-type transport system involved in multi-copper enzyme maturation permease subunit